MKKSKKRTAQRQSERRRETAAFAALALCLVVPMAAYCLCVYAFFPPVGHMAFSVVGLSGLLCAGAALGYLVNETLSRRKIGKCIPVLAAGLFLTAVSLVFLYVPAVAALFDGTGVAVYVTLWIFLAFDMICYVIFFRIPMRSWLRREKGAHRDGRKDWRDLLWYSEVHRAHGIGAIYPINKLFTILYSAALVLHAGFGWIRFLLPVVCCLAGLSGLTEAVLLCAVGKMFRSDRKAQGSGRFPNGDFEIWSGYFALALSLLVTSGIAFFLPKLLCG